MGQQVEYMRDQPGKIRFFYARDLKIRMYLVSSM